MHHFLTPVRLAVRIHHMIVLAASNAAVGGQAVMEGVMMRSPSYWAVALRRRDGEIVEVAREIKPWAKRFRWARLPVIRGVVALGGSLVIGFRALSVSAHYAAEDILSEPDPYRNAKDWHKSNELWDRKTGAPDEAATAEYIGKLMDFAGEPVEGFADRYLADREALDRLLELEQRYEQAMQEEAAQLPDNVVPLERAMERRGAATADTPETSDPESTASPESLKLWQILLAFAFAFGFTVLLFKLLPVFITHDVLNLTYDKEGSSVAVFIEGVIRLSIFGAYLTLMGFLPDMKRVFQYHSAEHKAINAWENGVELTPEAVNRQSRIHVRCGTAFMLWVFVVSYFVYLGFSQVVTDPPLWQVVLSRVVFLLPIAGLSFELIKFAGRYPNNKVLRGILAPGLWLQYLTTRQCTEQQCEVAVRSLEIVLEKEYPEADTVRDALEESEADDVEVMA